MRRLLVAAALGTALATAVTGCGSSSSSSSAQSGSGSTAAASPPSAAAAPTACTSQAPVTHPTGTTDLTKKPQVEIPDGPPPCNLVVGDLVEGKGAAAKPGDQLTMKYVGVLYSTGKEFDASWDRGEDFPFQLGAGQVIPGWDRGLVGMKVGGRRQLVIPPDLGYGPSGQGPIPPNATLVFVVDLVKIS